MTPRYRFPRILFGLILYASMPWAQAATSPFAAPAEERKAKQAIPPAGKSLVYVYRQTDAGPQRSPVLYVNKRASGRLVPNSFYLLTVNPGLVEIRADSSGSKTLNLQAKSGRVIFVQLTVDREGDGNLRQVSYGAGRQGIQRARLMLETREVTTVARAPDEDREGGSFSLILKGGSIQLGSTTQTVLGLDRTFSSSSTGFGAELEWRFRNGWAFGGEAYQHVHDYTTAGSTESGELSLLLLMVNGKKYFRVGERVQPYVGLGLGGVTASFSPGSGGGINGTAGGLAAQLMGGVAIRWDRVGIYTELKFRSARAEDASGQEVDASGTALFAGMSLHF